MKILANIILFILMLSIPVSLLAEEKEDLLVIRNTVINLLKQLVDQGVMTPEQAQNLVNTAQNEAATEAAEQAKIEQAENKAAEESVRVQYVPEIVKEQIQQEVRNELRAQVTDDVINHAKTNRWGIKDALPEWLEKFKFSGDIRLRAETEAFDEDNAPFGTFLDANETNSSGQLTFRDIQTDRDRARLRLRFGVDAAISNNLDLGLRFATARNPVSRNDTLGSLGSSAGIFDLGIDHAFLKYKFFTDHDYEWLTLTGGRMPNPWTHNDVDPMQTALVWDNDFVFDGATATARYNFTGGDTLFEKTESNKEVFMTVGAFALDEFANTGKDPWLFGAQMGGSMSFRNQNKFLIAASYYNYNNLQGDRGEPGDIAGFDFQVPRFMQQGNTLFDISDPLTPDVFAGYAADYELLALNAKLEFATFAPHRLKLTGEYVENIGYDADEVAERLPIALADDYDKETTGYQLAAEYGWPTAHWRGHWRVFLAYQYLERDAVLDAFADSNFLRGGTDAEGYILGGEYGLSKDQWLAFRWISSDQISGPEFNNNCDVVNCDFSYDRAQLDINTRF